MKKRILLAIGAIAAFTAFAAAQSSSPSGSSAPSSAQPSASPDQGAVSQESSQTTQETTTTNVTPSAASDTALTESQTTTITGTVRTYETGKSVTIARPDGSSATYVITSQSQLPSDVAVGKKVTITTTSVTGQAQPVIQTMTYSKKVTTKSKTESQK